MKKKALELEYTIISLFPWGQSPYIEIQLLDSTQPPLSISSVEDESKEDEEKKMLEKITPVEDVDSVKRVIIEVRPHGGRGILSGPIGHCDMIIYVTKEQYKELGSPPLLAKLRFKVGVVK